jgi:hypothetical protein
MALHGYRETIIARIKRELKFARGLYAEAINAILEGETTEGLSMIRDLVHAQITFKELAHQTGRNREISRPFGTAKPNAEFTARSLTIPLIASLGAPPASEAEEFCGRRRFVQGSALTGNAR